MANEKRLIDANALLDKVQFRLPIDNQIAEVIAGCVDITRRLIENAPTVDAVKVVYCQDCARCKKGFCTIRKDSWGATLKVGLHDFCSDGERKDNG